MDTLWIGHLFNPRKIYVNSNSAVFNKKQMQLDDSIDHMACRIPYHMATMHLQNSFPLEKEKPQEDSTLF